MYNYLSAFALSSDHYELVQSAQVMALSLHPMLFLPKPPSEEIMETIELSAQTVNPSNVRKIGRESFEIISLLGKGGYGKVSCSNLTK